MPIKAYTQKRAKNVAVQPRYRRIFTKTRVKPTIAFAIASVAQELLMCSQIGAARSLVQCSRALYRSGLFIGSRVKACRQNIADSVARVIFWILEGPTAAAMFSTTSVSKGTILRTQACAMDLLDKFACVSRFDEHLMALALVRLSVKLELYK